MSDFKNDAVYEFITKLGINFIGRLKEAGDKLTFTDVLVINMRPMQTPEGEMTMVPAMDMVGIFTKDNEFNIPIEDIYQISKVEFDKFIEMYETNINMYNQAKLAQGSNIDIVNEMPESVVRPN
jgi:hypothetical protein